MEIQPIRAFADNYIWLLDQGGALAVVDPGDAAPLLDHLHSSGRRLGAILLTHHHRDHTGGVGELLARFPVPVFGPAAEEIAGVDRPLAGGETIDLPGTGIRLQVLTVPGHTRGHLAYLWPDYRAGALFCGDTLFAMGCGRLFEGTPAQMHASLSRLAALDPDTAIYCAHEYTASGLRFATTLEPDNAELLARRARLTPRLAGGEPTVPFTLADELATNPFLRLTAPAVQAAIGARLGRPPHDEVEAFAVLRAWRDHLS